jgi:Ca2+-binding RTX toxin-like protein
VIEGEEGYDTLAFHGANIAEDIAITANNARVQLTRNIASVVTDFDGIEALDLTTVGGADQVTVADLSGTALKRIDLDLAAPAGAGTPDGAGDVVTLHGTTGDDVAVIAGTSAALQVSGLAATVNIVGADLAADQLVVQLHEGDDVCEASALQAALLLSVYGGPGDDVLIGSGGMDSLFGEEDDDILLGGPGVDILDGGSGNDVIIQD